MAEPKQQVFRVYADIVVQAAFDIVAGSAEEAADTLGTGDHFPVHTEDQLESVVAVRGVVASADVFGTNFDENKAEIERRKAAAARLAKENQEYAKQERFDHVHGDNFSHIIEEH